jgi:hypothetical protein
MLSGQIDALARSTEVCGSWRYACPINNRPISRKPKKATRYQAIWARKLRHRLRVAEKEIQESINRGEGYQNEA